MAKIVEGDSCLEIITHDGSFWVREKVHDCENPALYAPEDDTIHGARTLAASIRIAHDRTHHGPRAKGRQQHNERSKPRAVGHDWR